MQHWQKGRSHHSSGEHNDRRRAKDQGSRIGDEFFLMEKFPEVRVGAPDTCALAFLNPRFELADNATQQRRRKNKEQHLRCIDDDAHHVNLNAKSRDRITRNMYSK